MGKRGPPKGQGGVPRKEIDFEQFEKLCTMLCTEEEIAAFFSIDVSTLVTRIKEHYGVTFSEIFEQKKAIGKMAIRRAQYARLTGTPTKRVEHPDGTIETFKGNPPSDTMIIWMGKQHLGQKDQASIEHSGSIDIPNMTPEERRKRIAELEEELHGKRD